MYDPLAGRRSSCLRFSALMILLLFFSSGAVLWAQDAATEPQEETTGPKITFHGFLTQAYARSDGHQILGIPEEGTADYRTAALQIRADISRNDVFVMQLSHERLGKSPIQAVKDDLGLDWIFYEHRFGASSVKVGRVQIPYGIYNEVLDVGVLLPFYRPSRGFYGEGAYSSETVDGLVLSHDFELGRSWRLEANAYYGNMEFPERDLAGTYVKTPVDNTRGVELWVETPVDGLRLGTGGMSYEIASLGAPKTTWTNHHVSLSGEFERFDVHAEYKWVDLGQFDIELGYAQAGLHLMDKLKLNVQEEFFYFKTPGLERLRADKDYAIGLNYAFNPELVLKAEHHWTEGGFWLEDVPFDLLAMPKTRFWLVSLSTSF